LCSFLDKPRMLHVDAHKYSTVPSHSSLKLSEGGTIDFGATVLELPYVSTL
jgi:hypothetical protein